MSAPKYTVHALDAADLNTLAQFMFESQLAQATNRFLFYDWPADAAQISLYLSGMEQMFKDPSVEMFKVVDEASRDIIASLILTRKRTETQRDAAMDDSGRSSTPAEVKPPRGPAGVNLEFRAHLVPMLRAVLEETEGIEHFLLSSIFVKSSSRVQGIGSHLVKICIDRAREAKLPLFLSSVPSAHGFYLKQGFKDTTHADIDLTKWGPEYGGFGVYRLSGMKLAD